MPAKRYSQQQIAMAWALFKRKVVYKSLIAGVWNVFMTMDEARAAQPLKIEAKFAKDVMEFPAFLDAIGTVKS